MTMEDAAETPLSEENNQENDQSRNQNESNGKKERTLAGAYRFLMLGGGFFEIVLGVGICLVVNLVLVEQISLAYPYLTPGLLLFLQVWGIAGMAVPGCLLLVGGLWAGKLATIDPEEVTRGNAYKLQRVIIYVGAIAGLVGIPIGTFVGVVLIREMNLLKTPA